MLDVLKKIKMDLQNIDWEQLKLDDYNRDREYPENWSNWYPYILDFGKFSTVDIVSNQILTLEETKLFEEECYERINFEKINDILKPTLDKMDSLKIYNIKNGCFSDKFNFDVSLVTKDTLAEKLWRLNYDSHLYDTGGYTEIVVREIIPNSLSEKDNLFIYHGMPLREEIRVFYDMDKKEIKYWVDYWDYEYCAKNIYNKNDRIIFDYFHNKIGNREVNHFDELHYIWDRIQADISSLKFDKALTGVWSIDFLYNKYDDNIYLIDMARGFRSAYFDNNKI